MAVQAPTATPASTGSPAVRRPPGGAARPRGGVVVLRLRAGRDGPGLAARVARVSRTLAPGEVIAASGPAVVDAPLGRDGTRLRALGCRFAPDDWTTLIWDGPAPPEDALASSRRRHVDVRGLAPPPALALGAAAVAALDPGEVLVHLGEAPPILLLGLLEDRVVLEGVAWEGPVVVTRLRRRATPPDRR
jgi:hypothetical protein